MGFFDDMFSSEFLFDNEYRQRSDIEQLKQAFVNAPDPMRLIAPLQQRVDRLELLCKSLTELIISKGIASQAELSVVAQQLDLEDGREDGKIGSQVRANAPLCVHCGRYVNPKRDHCVYCNTAIAKEQAEVKPPPRLVNCGGCNGEVAESDTFYTEGGLRCAPCFNAG